MATTANPPVPSLSPSGWIQTPAEKIDALLVHFFASLSNQSSIYPDNVTSLPKIVKDNVRDETGLLIATRSALITYFQRYFESVTVDVNTEAVDGGFNIRIYAVVVDQGKEYSVGQLVVTSGEKIKSYMSINNNG